MNIKDKSRREFLSKILAATITTTVIPHQILGQIVPEVVEKGSSLQGIYKIRISEFSVLKNVWGSVRITIDGIDPKFHYPKLIVTKVPFADYKVHFTCVSEQCPHQGYPVELLNQETMLIECKKGHGSLYEPNGKYYWGVSKKDLTKYTINYDGDDSIFISIDALFTDIKETDEMISYLIQNYPNPADKTTKINFGVGKDANVILKLINMRGETVRTIINGFLPSGQYSEMIDISDLPMGSYLYNLSVNGIIEHSKIMLIVR